MENSFFANDADEKSTDSDSPPVDAEDMAEEIPMTDEARLAAIMSYVPFLCFFPLLKMRDHPQTRFHARQGVMLFLVELIAALFLIDGISDLIFKVVLIIAASASLAGIYFALKGESYRLPLIGDLVDRFKL